METEAATTAKNINQTISATSPLRIRVYTSTGPTFVILSIHHALFDGISLPFLMNDVEREFLQLAPRPSAVSSEILDQIASIDLDKARTFWVDYYKGFAWSRKTLTRAKVTSLHVTPSRQALTTTLAQYPLSIARSLPTPQQVTVRQLVTYTLASILAKRFYQSNGTFWVTYFKQIAWKTLPTSQKARLQALLTCTFASIAARRLYQGSGTFWVDYLTSFTRSRENVKRIATTSTRRQVTAFKSPLSTVKGLATSQQVTLQALLTCTFASIIANKIYQSSDVSFGVRLILHLQNTILTMI